MSDTAQVVISIDGTAIKTPATIKPTLQDISDPNAGRTAGGKMYTGIVRADVYTLEVTWNAITADETRTILGLLSGGKNHSVTAPDPREGDVSTKTYYCGDRKLEVVKWFDEDKRWNLSTTFIEV